MATKKKTKAEILGLPSEVTVLGKKFKVLYTKDMGKDDYGEMHLEEKWIKINTAKPEWTWKATLVHEMTHAGIGISGVSERMEGNEEEAFVILMEHVFEDFVRFE